MAKNKENEKASLFNTKITIITVVATVWVICIIFALAFCESQKEEPVDETTSTEASEDYLYTLPEYENTKSGTVTREESKTLAYFTQHYSNDYYRVKEYQIIDKEEGQYYKTEKLAYSTKGYIYKEEDMIPYEEMEFSTSSIATLITPTEAFTIYPSMKAYFRTEGNSQGYTNEINFSDDVFDIGTITINGLDYYYEEVTEQGIPMKYCYKDDRLIYRISENERTHILERYVEYSDRVDYSLFEIPADFILQE